MKVNRTSETTGERIEQTVTVASTAPATAPAASEIPGETAFFLAICGCVFGVDAVERSSATGLVAMENIG